MNVDRSISIRPSNAGNQALNNERLTTNRISELKNKYLPESNNTESVAINTSNNYSYSVQCTVIIFMESWKEEQEQFFSICELNHDEKINQQEIFFCIVQDKHIV